MRYSPLVLFHFCAGTLGMLSGAAALVFRKGSHNHRLAGKLFVLSMLSLAASGMYLALRIRQIGTFLGGALTFYLVATAWAASRRGDGETGLFEWGALLAALAVGTTEVSYGVQAVNSPTGLKEGYPPQPYFIFGFLILLCAAGDLRMLFRGGLFGGHRLARHLWRMCFALLIATLSFFPGQVKLFPASVRSIKILYTPHILIVALMVSWLFRVLLSSPARPASRRPSFPLRLDPRANAARTGLS